MNARHGPWMVAGLVAGLLAACGGSSFPDVTPGQTDILIGLDRGPCFGACPIYTVEIDEQGAVTYNGVRFVAVTGTQTGSITLDQVQTLLDAFEAANYFNLADQIEADVTDAQTVRTALTIGDQTHQVAHYHGDFDAPKALTELEDLIDEIANTRQWVGGAEQ